MPKGYKRNPDDEQPDGIAKEARVAKQQRHSKSAKLKRDWLEAYVSIGWRAASAKVGCAVSLPTYWRLSDPVFAAELVSAKAYITDKIEAVLEETAVGERDLTSAQTQLLKFKLQADRPDRYRDRVSIEQSGPDGGPIKIDTGDAGRGLTLLDRWFADVE